MVGKARSKEGRENGNLESKRKSALEECIDGSSNGRAEKCELEDNERSINLKLNPIETSYFQSIHVPRSDGIEVCELCDRDSSSGIHRLSEKPGSTRTLEAEHLILHNE